MRKYKNEDPSDFFQEFVGRLFDDLGWQPKVRLHCDGSWW